MKKLFVGAGCTIVGVLLLLWGLVIAVQMARERARNGSWPLQFSETPYNPSPVAVYPRASDLRQSVIVPTLDAKVPQGKNVIWCASFQLAWDRLGSDVLHAPPAIAHAEELAERLNRSRVSANDIPSDSYYAAAGRCGEGIVEKINGEMRRRFHREPAMDEIHDPSNVIVTYGYLEVKIPFPIHYFENPAPLLFKDGNGTNTNVMSFGANFSQVTANRHLRKQVRVLHCAHDANGMRLKEFVIDPCSDSLPNQVILACVPAEGTLQGTWNGLEKRTADYPRQPDADEEFDLDDLLVPSMAWDITHHFTGLEGPDKRLENKGFEDIFLLYAMQGIRFRLDRGGVELQSEALMAAATCIPRTFVFDHPFFVFVRKRDSNLPFFAMYVANAELLCKPK